MTVTRRRSRPIVLLAVLALAAGAAWWALNRGPAVVAACTATAGSLTFTITPEQAVNATTIAAEAYRQGLPAHAVSVGLAAAFQETKLRNLAYGDRDSLGLFQQRPSQGWGTPAQLTDTRYAAAAFFRALRRIDGWRDLPIYQAAQLVQHSADAAAYAGWDTESRTVAQGLTGQAPAGFSCRFPSVPRATATTRGRLLSDAATALGPDAFAADPRPAHGWLVASWLVSRAPSYSLAGVSFAGRTWTPGGGWRPDPRAEAPGVTYLLRRSR